MRVYLGGELVADTTHVKLVWEIPYFPQYYVPDRRRAHGAAHPDRHRHALAEPRRRRRTSRSPRTRARAVDAAWQYPDSPIEALRDHIRFDFAAMQWFEEDEEIAIHPRDPGTRIDVLDSSRHVQVIVNGVTVADTHHPRLLFETGLPTRYYVPKVDVRMDLLEPTDTATGCPYKGTAEYWSVRAGDAVERDLAWSYPHPLPESQKVAGLVCFYNEKVDLVVDGEHLERPHTKFS